MKKHLPVILGILLLFLVIGGGFYYKYNYIDTVTDYRVVKVTPPTENYFGGYSDPEIEIEAVRRYQNDSIAEVYERKRLERHRDYISKNISKGVAEQKNDIMKHATENAYIGLLSQEWTLISITHTRSFDSKPFARLIKQYGLSSEEVNNYTRRNKIQVSVYPL